VGVVGSWVLVLNSDPATVAQVCALVVEFLACRKKFLMCRKKLLVANAVQIRLLVALHDLIKL